MAKAKPSSVVYQLKITLKNVRPPIWRRLQTIDCSLYDLHDMIQTCMGWGHAHLHSFTVGGVEYSEPDPNGILESEDEQTVNLSTLPFRRIKKFSYLYDFGDGWDHTIEIEKELEAEEDVLYPRCIAGKRACPPEDCGGPWGYGDLLAAISDPKNKRHAELLEWVGGEFDPEEFDLDAINDDL